jgi:hypothetical protein
MQGIRDSIQQTNSKQIEPSVEELIKSLENMQINTSSVFDKPSLSERIKASAQDTDFVTGLTVGSGIAATAAGKAVKIFHKLPENKIPMVNEAMDEVLNNRTNLSKKGVKIVNLTSLDAPELKKTPKFLRFLDSDREIAKGKNAAYNMINNTITVNKEKMALSAFHEMGHAFNRHNSNILMHLQNARPFLFIAAIGTAFLPLILKETPKQAGEELTLGQKIKNGIRSATPLISGAAFLPIVIEEGIASLRASQFVKPLLEKGVYRKMVGGNICGFITYLTSMVALMGIAQYFKVSNKST